MNDIPRVDPKPEPEKPDWWDPTLEPDEDYEEE
jgi:hypothetical protein